MDINKEFSLAIVDDEEIFCKRLAKLISSRVSFIETFPDATSFINSLNSSSFDLIFLDLGLPDMDGMKILDIITKTNPDTEVIIITGQSSIDTAVKAIKKGACNYLCKPLGKHDLFVAIDSVCEKIMLKRENRLLKEELARQNTIDGIIANCRLMQHVVKTIKKIAPLNCNVLIQGDTGTGKQLVARAIHNHSSRSDRQFIAFNCGGFTEELIANELFGHEKGAFTGATKREIGLLEAGSGGTVFLDEIGELSLPMQAKLLHVIEEKRIIRLGSVKSIDLDIRIIAATNRNLKKMAGQGKFREDLFFRLNVVNITIPPLKDRKEDLPLLVSHFIAKYNRQFSKNITSLSEEAMEVLLNYDFPGNVRELENIIQRAIALSDGDIIKPEYLPTDIIHFSFDSIDNNVLMPLEEVERRHILEVLKFTNNDRQMAAAILGLPRTTLWRRMKKYNL